MDAMDTDESSDSFSESEDTEDEETFAFANQKYDVGNGSLYPDPIEGGISVDNQFPIQSTKKTFSGEHMFCCNVCYKTFAQKRNLKRHLRIHTDDYETVCAKDGPIFNEIDEGLMSEYGSPIQHIETENNTENQFCCNVCYKTFHHRDPLERHLLTHAEYSLLDDEGKPIVDKNKASFVNQDESHIQHIKTENNIENPFFCQVCYRTFSLKETFEKHLQTHVEENSHVSDNEDDGIIVKMEGKFVDQDENLIQEMETENTTENTEENNICYNTPAENSLSDNENTSIVDETEARFATQDKNNIQLMEKGDIGENQFRCDVCCKAFSVKRNLERHLRTHALDNLLVSDNADELIVDKTEGRHVSQSESIIHHIKTEPDEDHQFCCDVCCKTFSVKKNLERHLRTHALDNLLVSDNADESFVDKTEGRLARRAESIIQHIKTEPDEYHQFCCDVCCKTFSVKKNLERHLRTHALNNLIVSDNGVELIVDKTEGRLVSQSESIIQHLKTEPDEENLFCCDVCCKTFSVKKNLERHLQTHAQDNLLISDNGDKSIVYKTEGRLVSQAEGIIQHIKTEPVEDNQFCCNVCCKTFSVKKNLERHLQTHALDNLLVSDNGDELIVDKTEGRFENHAESIPCIKQEYKEENQFCCNICLKTFSQIEHFQRHLITHTEDPLVHNEDIPVLPENHKKVVSQEAITSQNVKKEHKKVNQFCCNVCYKTFSQKGNLKRHEMTHTEDGSSDDEDEHNSNDSKDGLVGPPSKHAKVKQEYTNVNQFCCNVCYKTFSQKGNLKTHLKKHGLSATSLNEDGPIFSTTGKKSIKKKETVAKCPKSKPPEDVEFRCDVCDKLFSQKGNLKTHMKTHIKRELTHIQDDSYVYYQAEKSSKKGEKFIQYFKDENSGEVMFSCYVCNKIFTQKGNLKRHLRIHTGERPFECNICFKNFGQKNDLKYHVKTHMGEKPFSCKVCDKPFTRKWYLSHHLRTHTGEKPFECDICYKHFTFKCSLNKHMKGHRRSLEIKTE